MASNHTSAPSSLPLTFQIGISILSLAFILGLPGNLFVIWSVLCRVKKRSVTCILVLNLAAADAVVMFTAPFFLRYLSRGADWELGSAVCKLVHYISSVNMYVSIYLICLMSMDRWLAVSRPFVAQRLRKKRSLLMLLLGVWVMAFLLSLPMVFYRSILPNPYNKKLRLCHLYHWGSVGHQVFQFLFETIMACVVPFTLINTCYSSIICRLRSAMFQRKGQGTRLILLIIAAFAVFWLPYHIVNIIQVAGLLGGSKALLAAAGTARPNVTALAYFSSAVNPILYVFAGSSHIRHAGLGFMGKLFEATNSESRSTSTSRAGRMSRSSTPDETSILQTLSVKLGRPFKGKNKDVSDNVADEVNGAELKTLATEED